MYNGLIITRRMVIAIVRPDLVSYMMLFWVYDVTIVATLHTAVECKYSIVVVASAVCILPHESGETYCFGHFLKWILHHKYT